MYFTLKSNFVGFFFKLRIYGLAQFGWKVYQKKDDRYRHTSVTSDWFVNISIMVVF